jgi:hypothetical protein
MAPATLDGARFTLHPSVALLHSRWAVAALWHAHQPGGPALPARVDTPCAALVVRHGWQVEVVDLGAPEAAALEQLAAGASFGEAIDAALAAARPEEGTPDIGAMLGGWFTRGVVAAVTANDAGQG